MWAASNCIIVRFIDCNIQADSIWNFSKIKNSNIRVLFLNGWGSSLGSLVLRKWRFINIIKGISNSPYLKASLSNIFIYNWKISEKKAAKMMNDNGLGHIRINHTKCQ